MEEIRSYLLSLILTAVICLGLPDLLREGCAKKLLKTLCGLVLAVTLLSPLGHIRLEVPQELPGFREEAALAADSGETLVREALTDVIRAEMEAYILDTGIQGAGDLRLELTLSQEPPYATVAVTLSGTLSPEEKDALQELLEIQFDIPKEAQTWIP